MASPITANELCDEYMDPDPLLGNRLILTCQGGPILGNMLTIQNMDGADALTIQHVDIVVVEENIGTLYPIIGNDIFFHHMVLFLAHPPAVDCSHLYRLGYTQPGVYNLDVTGANDPAKTVPTYCKDGWNYLLQRKRDNEYPEVRESSILF